MQVIPPDAARRLRRMLAAEIRRITADLHRRRGLLVELWGRHRVRTPFLDTVFQRYRTVTMSEMLMLDCGQAEAVEHFYAELDDLRFYLTYTEDMPRSLMVALDSALIRLNQVAIEALNQLGIPDPMQQRAPPPWQQTGPAGWGFSEE